MADGVFTSAAIRDLAIPHPSPGQQCVLIDTGLQVYAGPVAGWQPPWNMPWGEVSFVAASADFAVGTGMVVVTGLSTAVSTIPNRKYHVEFEGDIVTNTLNDTFELYICQSPTGGAFTVLALTQVLDLQVSDRRRIAFSTRLLSSIPASGVFTADYTIRADATFANTAVESVKAAATTPAHLAIYDIGPNGSPV